MYEPPQQFPPLAPPRRSGPWGPWASLGLGVLVFLSQNLAAMVVAAFFIYARISGAAPGQPATGLMSNGFFVGVSTVVTDPIGIVLIFVFAALRSYPLRDYLGLKPVSWRAWLLGLVGMIVYAFFTDLTTSLLHRPVINAFVLTTYRTARFLPLLWFAVLVLAPVFEELLFRGFLFEGFRQSALGAVGAILLTSAIWASLHVQYDLFDMANIFVLGIILGVVRLRTGSTYLTMTMHSLVSLLATIEAASYLHYHG